MGRKRLVDAKVDCDLLTLFQTEAYMSELMIIFLV